MSSKPLMLEGLVKEAPRDDEGHEWRKEKQQLEDELRLVRRELEDVTAEKEKAIRVIRNLRRQLEPLHRAVRAVFGEIELAIEEEETPTVAAIPRSEGNIDPRWQSYKNQFPGVAALLIDALLAHPDMSIPQLAALCHKAYNTVRDALYNLKKAGAVVSESGRYRLNR